MRRAVVACRGGGGGCLIGEVRVYNGGGGQWPREQRGRDGKKERPISASWKCSEEGKLSRGGVYYYYPGRRLADRNRRGSRLPGPLVLFAGDRCRTWERYGVGQSASPAKLGLSCLYTQIGTNTRKSTRLRSTFGPPSLHILYSSIRALQALYSLLGGGSVSRRRTLSLAPHLACCATVCNDCLCGDRNGDYPPSRIQNHHLL